VAADGLDLHVNGVRIFARGAVWTPADPVGLAADPAALLEALERVRDAGMNLLRVPGIGVYESDAFHDLCDELGLLVWQDLMFANFDYPAADPGFRALVEAEVRRVLERIGPRPSTAVVCGGSEVEQQAAMVGLDPAAGRGELFGTLLPGLVAAGAPGAVWVPSAPSGGDLPFRPGRGVANYYGVGAYGLPLEDARRSGVRFAAECLAFANVPDEAALEDLAPGALGHAVVSDPRWKAGVPRDQGASWDFDDVRDRYLALLFGADPAELRRVDPERYLELSRATSGEVMSEVLGEWRRAGSPCGGGLILWLRDLAPGAGWGLLDHRGRPKTAYYHVRRALAPIAVWTSDEQLGGIVVHVANDPAAPLAARLRVALYADGERRVEEAAEDLVLAGHGTAERNVEAMLGRFVDASWAYRFGPPAHDTIVASLERPGPDGAELLSQAVRFPAGRPPAVDSAARLGLEATVGRTGGGPLTLSVHARRLVYGLRIHAAGLDPSDDAFSIEPGGTRTVRLGGAPGPRVELSALNLRGRVAARLDGAPG
jgi:beta-mannosidase